jgi:hypothetical protein
MKRTAILLAATCALVSLGRTTEAKAPAGHFVVGTGAAAGTVYDTETKLTWQQTASSGTYVWNGSKTVCASVSLNGSGWRQPTMAELSTLIDFRATAAPFTDTTAFPGTPSALFWSITSVTGSTTQAWAVDFSNGFGNATDTTKTGYVRCVR